MNYDLTNLPTPVIICEIDDNSFHGHARFARRLDTLHAMREMADPAEIGVGYWMGEHNTCYVLPFDALRLVDHYICEQDAIVHVALRGEAELLAKNDKGVFSRVIGRGQMERPFSTGGLAGYTVLKSGIFTADFT